MHKEYTPVVRCVYSICGRTFVFIYASNQVKIMLFFGCVYSFHPQNSLVLSFYPQNFSSFATNPPTIHIHGMSIHYGIEIMRDPRPQNFPPPRADVKLLRVREIECSFQPKSTFFSIPAGTPYLVATALFHLFRAAENFWPFRICI